MIEQWTPAIANLVEVGLEYTDRSVFKAWDWMKIPELNDKYMFKAHTEFHWDTGTEKNHRGNEGYEILP